MLSALIAAEAARAEIMRMRSTVSCCLMLALLGAAPVLAGCEDFDMDKLDVFNLNQKKKLPGERREVFPGGVPGVTQGMPPEYLKGNQQQPDAACRRMPQPGAARPREPEQDRGGEARAKSSRRPSPSRKPKAKPSRSAKPKPSRAARLTAGSRNRRQRSSEQSCAVAGTARSAGPRSSNDPAWPSAAAARHLLALILLAPRSTRSAGSPAP